VPEGVKEIFSYAFSSSGASGALKTIVLPNSLTRVWEQGLGCASLESIRIPENLDELQFGLYGVFFSAISLKTLTVDEGNKVYKAVDNVLFSKDGETLVFYPEGMPDKHYNVPEGTKSLGEGAFMRIANGESRLESVTLPETLESVEPNTFRYQRNLASVNIPESLTEISPRMFLDCKSLKSVTLHSGITKIGDYAFMGCNSMEEFTCESVVAPQLGVDSFGPYYTLDTFEKFVLRIPNKDSLDSYTQAGWLEYASQVRYSEDNELPSDDATLSSLTVSMGTLTPAFDAEIESYSVSVPNTVARIVIATSPTHENAIVSGTGATNLFVGKNTIAVTVTAEDGTTTKTYSITVTREEPKESEDVETLAPGIAGPQSMTLKEGYAADSSGAFRLYGVPRATVKISGNDKITWNNDTCRLDIAKGLAAGTYIVAFKLSNGIAPDATFTFTLTIDKAEKPSEASVDKIDEWTGTGSAIMRIDAPFRDFVRLLLNGSLVDRANYDIEEGSTIITLKEAYLKQLENGTYELVAEFIDGVTGTAQLVVNANETEEDTPDEDEVEDDTNEETDTTGSDTTTAGAVSANTTKAEISTAKNSPATGDTDNILMWIVLGSMSLIVLCGVSAAYMHRIYRRKAQKAKA
jgi:hypothetical protein